MLCASGCEFQAHTVGVVRQLFDLTGRIIESQPTLGLWDMYAADMVATVPAEQTLRYGCEICHRNFPNKALFRKVHDLAKKVIHSQK